MSDDDLPGQMLEIERLVQELESVADPNLRSRTMRLVALLLDVHGAALKRMLAVVMQSQREGGDAMAALARDPLTASLLLLYDLHPECLTSRVHQALEKSRPLLRGHGGDVELLSCEDGVVQLRLTGSCHGCPSSTATLKQTLTENLCEFAPDIRELHVEGVAERTPAGFVPLQIVSLSAESAR